MCLGKNMVEEAIHQITQAIPDIRWLRFVRVDGLAHPTYMYHDDGHRHDTEIDREEDRYSAMTAASISLGERILYELVLGTPKSVVLNGEFGTYFMLPLGDGSEWVISFVVKGHPSVDATIKYFQDRQYLASIVPALKFS